ncbi:MAG: CDC27 family protein [Candidatus Methanoplasma sp.]|jgi:hypothetical protein|nr:CDC27 family protein [Candidatus Methanoplasma sp.]
MLGANADVSVQKGGNLGEREKASFNLGLALIKTGATAQGYRIFKNLSLAVQHPAVFFNLALCQVDAEAYQVAAASLENALSLIGQGAGTPPADSVYDDLRLSEKTGDGYRSPFRLELPSLLPMYAKECIRRCLVDVYSELGLVDKARATAASLEPGFANVSCALEPKV